MIVDGNSESSAARERLCASPDIAQRPLLTLAVPTYNRQRFLATFLRAIAPQLAGERRVELLISDNGSADGTSELVAGYIAGGLPIRYIRNETNIGGDQNFL